MDRLKIARKITIYSIVLYYMNFVKVIQSSEPRKNINIRNRKTREKRVKEKKWHEREEKKMPTM